MLLKDSMTVKTGTGSRLKSIAGFAGILILFLILRFSILCFGLENVSHPDELGVGALTQELIDGLKFSIWDYQVDYYAGESIVLAALAIPFFLWLGPALVGIKLVTLLFSLLGLVSVLGILWRFFSPKAALYCGILFCAAFPTLVQISLNTMAGHSESAALSFLSLWFFYNYWNRFKLSQDSRMLPLVLFSFISGFNFWFHHVSGLLTAACLLTSVIDAPRFLKKKDFAVFFFVFLAGFSPYFLRLFQASPEENQFFYHFLLEPVVQGGVLGAIRKLLSFLLKVYPLSFFMTAFGAEHGIFKSACSGLYFFVTTLNVFILVNYWFYVERKLSSSWKYLPCLIYPPLFLIFYSMTSYSLGTEAGYYTMRYLTVWYFMLLMIAGLNTSRLGVIKSGWLLLILLGFWGQKELLLADSPGRLFRYQATDYAALAGRFINSPRTANPEAPQTWLSMVDRFPSREIRNSAWLGYLTDAPPWDLPAGRWSELFNEREDDARFIAIKYGASAAMFKRENFMSILPLPVFLKDYAAEGYAEEDSRDGVIDYSQTPLELRHWNFFNEGRNAYMDMRRQKAVNPPAGSRNRETFFRGFGKEKAVWVIPRRYFFELSETESSFFVSREDSLNYYWGLGWGIRSIFREDPLRAEDWLRQLPSEYHEIALRGARAFEERYGFDS